MSPVESGDEPPEWLSLSARYSRRHSLGKRRIDIVTTNNGATEIVVTRIAIRAEHFEELQPEDKKSVIRPGGIVDIKADFGEVLTCDDDGPLSVWVMLEFVIGSAGPSRRYEVAIDPGPLQLIRDTDCNERIVRDAVNVSFDQDWSVDGRTIRTQLVLDRNTGNETITVTAVRGMILFSMQPVPPKGASVAVLDPGVESLLVPVEMALARCDAHAVSQAPDGYSFRVWVAVGDHDPQLVTVFPQDRLLEQLEDLVLTCLETSASTLPKWVKH